MGVAAFTADVFAHNHAMLKVFHKSGCEMKSSLADGVYHLEFFFAKGKQKAEDAPGEVRAVGAR